MSRFNVRPITVPPPPVAPLIANKAPNAYRAANGGSSAPVAASSLVAAAAATDDKKKGRPSKDELRRHKMAMASAGIALLVSDKPTRNKVHKYFAARIETLDEEKR